MFDNNGVAILGCVSAALIIVGIVSAWRADRKKSAGRLDRADQQLADQDDTIADQDDAIIDLTSRVEAMQLGPKPETERDADRFEFMVELSEADMLAKDAAVYVTHVDANSVPSSRLEQVRNLIHTHRSGGFRLNENGRKGGHKDGHKDGHGHKDGRKQQAPTYKVQDR